MIKREEVIRIGEYIWEISANTQKNMNVPVRFYASEKMLPEILADNALQQAINVAMLNGIVKYSLAMPDVHYGYGFPIGGVAAMNVETGTVSPGGVGYDINCGVRLLLTNFTYHELSSILHKLVDEIFKTVPAGVGAENTIKLKNKELVHVLTGGAQWATAQGFGNQDDIDSTEDFGCFDISRPEFISERALQRGASQLGTLGSGNHFIEIQQVQHVCNKAIAKAWGLFENQIVIMIHCGSRGLGHQICEDYAHEFVKNLVNYDISLPDRQLACAPINSPHGMRYIGAMAAAANYAWANRQIITHNIRLAFAKMLNQPVEQLSITTLYDIAHNIAKFETHHINDENVELLVHRKGATRAFPPQHPELPLRYMETGQPVIIPGDMGRASYLLVGKPTAMTETFGSVCHGAGRLLSRNKAVEITRKRDISKELAAKNIYVRCEGRTTLNEEVPEAYKNIDDVIECVEGAGLAQKIVRLKPLAVIKG